MIHYHCSIPISLLLYLMNTILGDDRDEPEVIDPTLEVPPISMTQLILGAQQTFPISGQEIETLRLKNRLKVGAAVNINKVWSERDNSTKCI